jgi:hypothetical protein
MDERLSDYASRRTPVFGSQEKAGDASNDLRSMARASYYITAVMAQRSETLHESLVCKGKGLLVGELASLTSKTSTGIFKNVVGRQRPGGGNTASFPSGHASTASVRAGLACRNIDYLPVSKAGRVSLKTGVGAMAAGTAWARVEAGVHYPADVLAGLALGNFCAVFFNDAFLSQGENRGLVPGIEIVGDKLLLAFSGRF